MTRKNKAKNGEMKKQEREEKEEKRRKFKIRGGEKETAGTRWKE